MSGGRTIWLAKDAAWWRREWIVELGEEFGPVGPAVIDWLECEAKAQNYGGHVKAGMRTVARGCFTDAVTVSHVLSRAVTLGLLVDFEERDGRFEGRIYWWKPDQERSLAASRKAAQRTRATDETGEMDSVVTVSHGESRSVTKCPPTEQNQTKDLNNISSDASGADANPIDEQLCRQFAELAKRRNPKFKVRSRGRWLQDMRLLRVRDGNSPEHIERAMRWVFDDEFWGGVIQSPASLREHFPKVWDRMSVRPIVANGDKRERQSERLAALERLTGGAA